MIHPGQVGSYAFSAMLPQDADLPLQNFERTQPPDLEGRMSNVMLAYDGASSASMPMNLDPTQAFAYDAPAYPATTMGMPQYHQSTYPSFQPTMPVYSQPTLGRRDLYDTSTDSTANFEDSDFSGRNSDRSQVQARAPRRPERPGNDI
jgi:pre-rRNA-processing protein SRD1